MSTITFDKSEYKAGEGVTITYGTGRTRLHLRMKNPSGTELLNISVTGSGIHIYILPDTAPLGTYRVELYYLDRSGRAVIVATATMKVVSGVPSAPPDEGETRELDLGDYEVTWTLSGNDTLKAEITVTDTGVTCLSVTGGACYSATPPGVTISTFTVTGHLKSAVAPPTRGYLTVTTSPTGVSVKVGTVSCGTTPVTACALSPGWKEIILTKSGYKTRVLMEEIKAGQTLNLGTITLTPTTAPPTPPDAAKFGLSEIVENHLPEWITGYACAGCGARYPYKCPFGYKRTECRSEPTGSHGCCSYCSVVFVKCEQEGVVPPVEIGSWIDESGVTNLTPSHAMYVYYLSQGATGAADTKYAGLSPKPSRMDPSIATVDNAMGIFYYSQGAMGAGNAKTGCNY